MWTLRRALGAALGHGLIEQSVQQAVLRVLDFGLDLTHPLACHGKLVFRLHQLGFQPPNHLGELVRTSHLRILCSGSLRFAALPTTHIYGGNPVWRQEIQNKFQNRCREILQLFMFLSDFMVWYGMCYPFP